MTILYYNLSILLQDRWQCLLEEIWCVDILKNITTVFYSNTLRILLENQFTLAPQTRAKCIRGSNLDITNLRRGSPSPNMTRPLAG